MQVVSPQDEFDLAGEAEELLGRWERTSNSAAAPDVDPQEDCLPCVVADWDGDAGC